MKLKSSLIYFLQNVSSQKKERRLGNKGQRTLINLESQYQHIYDNTGQNMLLANTLFLSFEFHFF